MADKRHVIVITGAAGSGKTSVSNYLEKKYGIPRVITHTTRKPRFDEVDGKNYYFESDEGFDKLHLLENVQYSGNRYGSSMEGLNRAFQRGNIVSIVLDTKGALTYKNKLKDEACIIFLRVAKPNQLKIRMLKRGDSLSAVNKRIKSKEDARDLILPVQLSDTASVIDNENWNKTKQEVDKLVKSLK